MKNPLKAFADIDDKLKAAIIELVEDKVSEKIAEDIPKARIAGQRVVARALLANLAKDDKPRAADYQAAEKLVDGD